MLPAAPLARLEQPGWVAEGSLGRAIWRRHAWADTAGRGFFVAGLSSGFAAIHAQHTQFVARALGRAEASDSGEPVRLPVVPGRRATAAQWVLRSAADRAPLHPSPEPLKLATLDKRPEEHALEASAVAPTLLYIETPTGAAPGQAATPMPTRTTTSGGGAGVAGPTVLGRGPLVTRADSRAESRDVPHAIASSPLRANVIASSAPQAGVANAARAVDLARASRDDENALTSALAAGMALSRSEPCAPPRPDANVAPSTADVQTPQAGAVDLQRRFDPGVAPSLDAEPQLQPAGATGVGRAATNAAWNTAARPLRQVAAHAVAGRVDANAATKVDAKLLPRGGNGDLARRSDADSSPALAELRADAPFAPLPEHAAPAAPTTGINSEPASALNIKPTPPGLTIARASVARAAMDAFAPAAASPESSGRSTNAVPRPTVLEAHADAEQQTIGSFDAAASAPGGTGTNTGLPLAHVPAVAAPPVADISPLAEPARFAASHADSPAWPVARRAPAPVDWSRTAELASELTTQPLEAAAAEGPFHVPPAMPASASASLTLPMPPPHAGTSAHAMRSASGSEPIFTATAPSTTQLSTTGASLTVAAVKRSAIPKLAEQASSVTVSASPRSLSAGSPLPGAVMQPAPGNEPVSAADVQADFGTSSAPDAGLVSTTHTLRADTVLSSPIGSSVTPTFAPHTDAFPLVVANRKAGSTSPSLTAGAGIDRVLSRSTVLSGSGFAAPSARGVASSGVDLAASTMSLQRSIDSMPSPTERFSAEPQPAAAHAGGAAVDLDELVERTLQALMLRLDIERERRGFNRWA